MFFLPHSEAPGGQFWADPAEIGHSLSPGRDCLGLVLPTAPSPPQGSISISPPQQSPGPGILDLHLQAGKPGYRISINLLLNSNQLLG